MLTQSDVAERMGVTKSRISQVERGDVSTFEVIARYVQPLASAVPIYMASGPIRIQVCPAVGNDVQGERCAVDQHDQGALGT